MSVKIFEGYSALKPTRHPGGWAILPIPYWSDPDKDKGSEWEKEQRGHYDREEDWNREMLCDFSAQLGIAAYPSFNRRIHVPERNLKIVDNLPILLACDFNLDPLIIEICQNRRGVLYVVDEIALTPGTIDKGMVAFRNLYPSHPGGIHIYGDSNGVRKNVQTGKSEYDLMILGLSGYTSTVELKVPRAHPNQRDRINSLNRKLIGHDDIPGVYVNKTCVELIEDFEQVVLRPDGKDVLKSYKDGDSYKQRTHASDALGYLTHREWPVRREVLKMKSKNRSRQPLEYGELLGAFGG